MSLNNHFIKDLSKIGRNLKKTIIIDNVKENFLLQPNNGLHISNFLGDEKDSELLNLANDLRGNQNQMKFLLFFRSCIVKFG
jgi:TFIIF-interacting CTD phosphatase-like protein